MRSEAPLESSGKHRECDLRPSLPAATTFLLLGGYTLLIQIVLLRECFALFAGNELSVAIQLGSWLILTAIGGLLGSR